MLGARRIGSLTAKAERQRPDDVNGNDSGVYYCPKLLHRKPNGYELDVVSECYLT